MLLGGSYVECVSLKLDILTGFFKTIGKLGIGNIEFRSFTIFEEI